MPHPSWRAGAAAVLLLALPIGASAQQPRATAPAPAPAATYTEAQLRDFARATRELDELHRGLGANPTEEQRQQAAGAAQTILQRHNLDTATYNAITMQARSDEALAQRIRAMIAED
jgi:hypothetical protein